MYKLCGLRVIRGSWLRLARGIIICSYSLADVARPGGRYSSRPSTRYCYRTRRTVTMLTDSYKPMNAGGQCSIFSWAAFLSICRGLLGGAQQSQLRQHRPCGSGPLYTVIMVESRLPSRTANTGIQLPLLYETADRNLDLMHARSVLDNFGHSFQIAS